MRKYALVILNNEDKIIDRFNLDFVENPTGNGFELSLSVISTKIQDVITQVKQKKIPIQFTIMQNKDAYIKANILANWIQKYSPVSYRMALEYNDGKIVKYCEGRVTMLTKTELDEFKSLPQNLTFTPTTPYFIKKENVITIQVSSVGKTYPFTYPYCYGASKVENNEIDNPYILDIPLIITINGAITNPTIDLLDANGNSYNRVAFDGMTIDQGEQLVINSAQMKIYKIDTLGKHIDYKPEVDPKYDTFLWAQSGISKLSINTSDSAEGFKLTGGWRQYTL